MDVNSGGDGEVGTDDRPRTIRRYPAFIEDKTFLPTYNVTSKAKSLDDDDVDYGELTSLVGEQFDANGPRPVRLSSDAGDNVAERWHVCEKCNKVFGTSKELRRHLPRHKVSKKVFECEICCRTFTQSNHLKQHMPVHSGMHVCMCVCMYVQRSFRLQTREFAAICTKMDPTWISDWSRFALRKCSHSFRSISDLFRSISVRMQGFTFTSLLTFKGPVHIKLHRSDSKTIWM